jgi:hypothetical protein
LKLVLGILPLRSKGQALEEISTLFLFLKKCADCLDEVKRLAEYFGVLFSLGLKTLHIVVLLAD